MYLFYTYISLSLLYICTAYCIWSVIQSQSRISISMVSFQLKRVSIQEKTYIYIRETHTHTRQTCNRQYGVATCSRLLRIIGLFCKRALSKRRYSAKETCDFKEPTNRSHPISDMCVRKCTGTSRSMRIHMLHQPKQTTIVYTVTQ